MHVWDLVGVVPLQQPVEVATLLVHAEVRIRHRLVLVPYVGNGLDVGVAHQVLQQDVDAVVEVVGKCRRRLEPPPRAPVVLVVGDEAFAQRVEAVDLMEDVDVHHVRIRGEAPLLVGRDGEDRVFAELDELLG